jgi:beta-glucosidase
MGKRATELIDRLSLEEQVKLLSGEDLWSLPAIERLGVGKLRMTDGPNGARGSGSLIGNVKSTAFPVGVALGATWNPALVREIGGALATQVKAKGAHVLLAPTVNIQRSVTNGRNFECYAEDPFLTGELAVAYIEGVQGEGVSATVKHFVGNESEIERTTIDSRIDERTLREVYLAPFERAVKSAGVWAVMTSYNKLNGTYTSENGWLLDAVLRQEWRYRGLVMSDWFGSHSTAPTLIAGLDVEMPGPPRDRGDKLVAAVRDGTINAALVRERALNVLNLMERVGAIDKPDQFVEAPDDRAEHRALVRRAGADAMVLLKNNGVLPLAPAGKIAVIGPNARAAQIMGGGSAQLNPHYRISPWDGLLAQLGPEALVHETGCANQRWEPLAEGEFEAEFFSSGDLSGPVAYRMTQQHAEAFLSWDAAAAGFEAQRWSARFTGAFTAASDGVHRIGLCAAGYAKAYIDGQLVADAWTNWRRGRTFFEEGCDEVIGALAMEAGRTYRVTIEFAAKQAEAMVVSAFRLGVGLPIGDREFSAAVAAARAAETAIVCVGRNGQWDTEGSDLLDIKLPGRQDELVAAVAAVNPNTVVVLQTGGPVEMPWLASVAAVIEAWYPGQEAGNAIADVLLGKAEPGGRLPQSFPAEWAHNPTFSPRREVYPGLDGKMQYEEGVFIGYRHYDRTGIKPMFPFGYGLSYTSFALSDLTIDSARFEAEGIVEVAVRATNTGSRAGSEVVQLYVSDEAASVPRPKKELKAFAKLRLEPSESQRVVLRLDPRSFAYFDVAQSGWLIEPGAFTIHIGRSAANEELSARLERGSAMRLPK